jgi:ATP-binding cassette subfamily F protein uup
LLFDEPTNDLDIKTLEVLEESFTEYPGAIVLITHDRYLLDRTATVVLGLGHGRSGLYGDYLQWEAAETSRKAESSAKRQSEPIASEKKQEKQAIKLTFKEQRDLGNIEQDILKAEELLSSLQREATSDEMISNPKGLIDCYKRLSEQQAIVEGLYSNWAALEQKKKEIEQRKIQK